MARAESILEREIVKLLRKRGFLVIKIPNEYVRGAPTGVMRGAPDLAVLLPRGVCVWLEVKTPNGRVTPAQREAHAAIEALGHKVHVVRSLADAENVVTLYSNLYAYE